MKINSLTILLAPPVWAYSAGFTFGTLAAVLGSEHADVVTVSARAVGFALSFPIVGWMVTQSREVATLPEYTSQDLKDALRAGREEERQLAEAARSFASEIEPGEYAVKIGKRKYNFPAGITQAHLLKLAEVVGHGDPPTDRALVPPFVRGDGKTYQTFRDWMVYHAGEKPGDLAQFRSGKMDWDVTPLGAVMLYEWLKSFYPPTATPPDVKLTLMSLSKAFRARTSKENNAIP